MPDDVTVSLTGPFAVRVGDRRQKLRIAGNTRRLLTLLAANFNHGLRRESVIADIWPQADAQRGASALNTAIWRIKSCLARHPGLGIDGIDDVIRMTVTPPATVDVALLEQAVDTAATEDGGEIAGQARTALARAVALCRGPFLEGCDDHWALPMRERYSALYIRALLILMRDAAARSAVECALEYGRHVLVLDPFREGTQREVMQLYLLNGQRVQALLQYEGLSAMLRDELGIEPMAETTALYARIRGGQVPRTPASDRIRSMAELVDIVAPADRV